MAKCHITGQLELSSSPTSAPIPARGAVLKVFSGLSDGEILASTTQEIPVAGDGSVSFYATQGATLWIWANAKGFDRDPINGTPFLVPETATALLIALQAQEIDPLTQVPVAVGSITIIGDPPPFFDAVEQYGADPSGTDDSTAAILSALAAAEAAHGVLWIPAGTFRIAGSGDQIFLITKHISIRGAGMQATRLIVNSAVPSSRDIFRVFPDVGENEGYEIRDFLVIADSGNPARHGINLDASTRYIARVLIERVYLYELGGYGIATTNTPVNMDGIFSSDFNQCAIGGPGAGGGILLSNAGDSLRVKGCTIATDGYALDADFVQGAASFLMDGCNITSDSGIIVRNGIAPVFQNNNIELLGGSNGAALDFDGGAGANLIQTPIVKGNQFSLRSETTPLDACRFNYTYKGIFSGNSGFITLPKVGLRVTANATGLPHQSSNSILDEDSLPAPTYATAGPNLTGDVGWTEWTPTITSDTGTLTSAGGLGWYKYLDEHTIIFRVNLVITTNGTGAGAVKATVPFTPINAFHAFAGRDNGLTSKTLNAQFWPDLGTLFIKFYDATYPGADGASLFISGVVEA